MRPTQAEGSSLSAPWLGQRCLGAGALGFSWNPYPFQEGLWDCSEAAITQKLLQSSLYTAKPRSSGRDWASERPELAA